MRSSARPPDRVWTPARVWAFAAICVAACVFVDVAPQRARAQIAHWRFPLRVHLVNHAPSQLPMSFHWVESQMAAANARFAASNVQFSIGDWSADRLAGGRPLDSAQALVSSADGRAGINVFVVFEIDDLTACSSGVALAPEPSAVGPGLVAVAPAVGPTLAHQLGRYFGLEHTGDPQNLMSASFAPGESGEALTLDPTQALAVSARADALVRAGRVLFYSDGPILRGHRDRLDWQ